MLVSQLCCGQVSTMKCGLLPLCHEAMTLGEIAYSEYSGGGADDAANVQQALSTNAKVRCILFLFVKHFHMK